METFMIVVGIICGIMSLVVGVAGAIGGWKKVKGAINKVCDIVYNIQYNIFDFLFLTLPDLCEKKTFGGLILRLIITLTAIVWIPLALILIVIYVLGCGIVWPFYWIITGRQGFLDKVF